ncbi:MAG: hypothetical protein H0X01_09835, partial [Nitrospira sp.]|nr:hypothetical protein [Nitrospira sp.]
FEPVLAEMSNYAEAVTEIPKCTFTIGAGDVTETYPAGKENPFKYVLNIGDSDVPVVQVVLTGRFDGTEARLLNALVRSVLGGMDFVLAHDYSTTFDLHKIGHQLGLPVQCLRENALQCGIMSGNLTDVNVNLLGWAFIFADNPKLLGKSETRWDSRMSFVDNEFAGAFYGLRTFFDSMVARSQALAVKAASDDELHQYILIYKDANENGLVDAADDLGVNITAVNLSPEFLISQTGMESSVEGRARAIKMRKDFKDTEAAVKTGLGFLRGGSLQLSEGSVAEVDLFFERFYGNMQAVDVPETEFERIPIDSFNTLIQDFLLGVFDSTPTPNFMELDLRSYFVEPKPLRKFLPYWEMTTDPTVYVGSRFLLDSDDYDTGGGEYHTLPEILFSNAGSGYSFFDIMERDLLTGTYDGGTEFGVNLTGISAPSDCVNANNIYSIVKIKQQDGTGTQDYYLRWPVMMVALQDPSFNGVIYTDMGAWTSVYNPTKGNGVAGVGCPNPSGFLPASNYSLTKSMWMYLDFLVDHFTLTTLITTSLDFFQ